MNELNKNNCCQKMMNLVKSDTKNSSQTEISDDYGHTPINKIIKILVLGPGDSGKSTILKQMRIIHGKNYNINERKKYKHLVIQNIIDSVIRLVDAMQFFCLRFQNETNEDSFPLILNCQQSLKFDLNDWNQNLSKYCEIIKSIWTDDSIRTVYQRRNRFYLSDSTEFFINNLTRICSATYVPEIDDLLRVRQPTTAIHEYKFKISGTYFLFVDVGGQRSERRKWINCFENITSILFVAALSDYDLNMSLNELKSSNTDSNKSVNKMKDAICLFNTLINWKKKIYLNMNQNGKLNENSKESKEDSKRKQSVQVIKETFLFDKVSIILFLNKEDLFDEKFRHSSIKACFEDYEENSSAEEAKSFIAHKFLENDLTRKRDIYYHYTFALDRKNIETVVASVKDRIMKYMLESMRL